MVDVVVIPIIHTVLVNVSGTVDGLGGVEWVFTPPWFVVPAVVVVSVRVVVRAGISVHMVDHLIRRDHVPVLGYRHSSDPCGHGGRVPICEPSVRHQLYCNVHPSNRLTVDVTITSDRHRDCFKQTNTSPYMT